MKTSGELRNDFYKWLDDNPDGRVWDWMHKILKEEKSNQVEAQVKHDFCDTYIVHLIERQLQGHSGNIWETIEAFENEDMAIDKKRMLNRRDTAYAHRVTSIKLTDKLSKNSV